MENITPHTAHIPHSDGDAGAASELAPVLYSQVVCIERKHFPNIVSLTE